jgi:Mrp family chromosome partitioning ATPase
VCWVDLSWAGADVSDEAAEEGPLGIRDVLSGAVDLDGVITVDGGSGVSVLTAGSAQDGTTISYRSKHLDATVAALGAEFDHIVFDMPPVLESSAALPLFRFAGGYLLVVRAGVTRRDQAARSTRQLSEVALLGTVLNRQRSKIPAFLRRLGSD